MQKIELLAPAGDMEKLKTAVRYGADAVYFGGEVFSLRAGAGNLTVDEMKDAMEFLHTHGAKGYLTINIYPHNEDILPLQEYIQQIRDIPIDAFLVSDPGVMQLVKDGIPNAEIHLSTQANTTNYLSANFWVSQGVKRIVAAREMSLKEIREMREHLPEDIEIEAFLHGAMCISYSGRCLLSNYMVGRDANRGDCAQPCRWKYHLVEETRPGQYFPVNQDDKGTYIFNSRDLCMIDHIPELDRAGIDSFKIEGRAKSEYYTAIVTYAYRHAIDEYINSGRRPDFVPSQWILDEMEKMSHREYTTGFNFGPIKDGQVLDTGGYIRNWDVCALYKEQANGRLVVTQRNRFYQGDVLEVVEPFKKPYQIIVEDLYNVNDEEYTDVANKATDVYSFRCDREISPDAIFRVERK